MTFVFETIDQARAQELIRKVREPIHVFQSTQVIDRERDLVFVDLGGHGNSPQGRGEPTYYNLFWKGVPVAFEGYDELTSPQGILTVEINLTKMFVPGNLKNLVPEIQQAIVEAISIYWSGRFERPVIANVQFPISQIY